MEIKAKKIGVWDRPYESGTWNACFSCARKNNLDLCGTPSGYVECEFCGAPRDLSHMSPTEKESYLKAEEIRHQKELQHYWEQEG